MKSPLWMAATTALVLLGSQTSDAQVRRNIRPPIAKYQPYTSPALGMLGPGGAAYGYFTQTQPQNEARQSMYNFNRDFTDFEKQVNQSFQQAEKQLQGSQSVRRTIGTTGHPTSFMNYGGYFPGRR